MKNSFLLPILILAAVALGCSSLPGIGSKSETNNASASNSGTASVDDTGDAIEASSDPKGDLKKMSDIFMARKSFRARMDATGRSPMKMEVDYIAPDRFHIRNLPTMEAIIIGSDTYIKTGDAWKKVGVDLGKSIPQMRETFTEEGLKLISDVSYEGDETANGQDALVYRYSGKSPVDKSTHNARIWIAKKNGLPLKIEATYPSGMLEKMVINYDYDTEIVIEAPIKK